MNDTRHTYPRHIEGTRADTTFGGDREIARWWGEREYKTEGKVRRSRSQHELLPSLLSQVALKRFKYVNILGHGSLKFFFQILYFRKHDKKDHQYGF